MSTVPLHTCFSEACFRLLPQILDFRGPAAAAPLASAVGASIALDKICIAVAAMEEPVRLMHQFLCLIFSLVVCEHACHWLAVLSCSSPQPPVSSCDVLVVPVGHTSMSRAINVMQKLWTAGVSADLVYDVSQVRVFTFDLGFREVYNSHACLGLGLTLLLVRQILLFNYSILFTVTYLVTATKLHSSLV